MGIYLNFASYNLFYAMFGYPKITKIKKEKKIHEFFMFGFTMRNAKES